MTQHLERNPLRIGITCGDLNGIGIEVVLKCFEDARMHTDITPILYANAHTVSHHRKALKLDEVQFQRVNDARDAVALRRRRLARRKRWALAQCRSRPLRGRAPRAAGLRSLASVRRGVVRQRRPRRRRAPA